jgi:hypothetical protein
MRQLAKKAINKVSMKEGLRREMRQNLSKSEQSTDFLILYEAINYSSEKRSNINKYEIKKYLFQSYISPYLESCSSLDLDHIVASVSTKEFIGVDDIIASSGEYIDFLYIILEGEADVVYSESIIKPIGVKEVLGTSIFNGSKRWDVDIHTNRTTDVYVLCIPVDVLIKYVGRGGSEANAFLTCFWKSTKLWPILNKNIVAPLFNLNKMTKANPESSFNLDLIDFRKYGKILVYQPGAEIFTQGSPRHHFHLVVNKGECVMLKEFPLWCVNAGIMPKEVDIGLRLLSGDFSFMDGVDIKW